MKCKLELSKHAFDDLVDIYARGHSDDRDDDTEERCLAAGENANEECPE